MEVSTVDQVSSDSKGAFVMVEGSVVSERQIVPFCSGGSRKSVRVALERSSPCQPCQRPCAKTQCESRKRRDMVENRSAAVWGKGRGRELGRLRKRGDRVWIEAWERVRTSFSFLRGGG